MKIAPKELDLDSVNTFRFDYDNLFSAFLEDDAKAFAAVELRSNKKSFKLVLVGELTTEGIHTNDYGHSIGIVLEDAQDAKMLEELSNLFALTMTEVPKDFEIKPVLRNGTLYLKMKEKNGKYVANCDISINPKNPKKGLERGQPVHVEVDIKAYLNFKSKIAGFYFPIISIKTKLDGPPPKKAKKLSQ
jgi:hypothetical protein